MFCLPPNNNIKHEKWQKNFYEEYIRLKYVIKKNLD